MKKLTLIISLLLCVVFCVFAFTSCGKKPSKQDPSNKGTDATTDRWEILGPEVAASIPAADRSIKMQLSAFGNAEKTSKNKKYLAGPDAQMIADGSVDTLDMKIYDRNEKAKELLGMTIEYEYKDDLGWGNQAGWITRLVEAKDETAPDVFVDMLYDLNKAMLSVGCFKDVWSLPESYFDFDAKGWMKDWMESLSFTRDRAYILGSDYFIDIFRNMGILPLNMTLMDEKGSSLAPALFNESLGAGEKMTQRFFDYVEEGNWTWDSLKKLCEAVWVDSGSTAGQNDFNDVLGIVTERYSGMPAALILYSTGEVLTKDVKQSGNVRIKYPAESTALSNIFEAVKGVYSAKGTLVTNSKAGDPDFTKHYAKFAENTLLFADPSLLGTLEDDVFQQMTAPDSQSSPYSVVPLPKVSVDKQYNTIIHNTADVGAINVNVSKNKARAISAYLQYVSEHSGAIREEFLQIVTKYKTTVYNQGTDRMLDLIYDSVVNARDKALEDAVDCSDGRGYRFHERMKEGGFVRGADYISTEYASIIDAKQAIVDGIMDKWYKLPTAATEATQDQTPAE